MAPIEPASIQIAAGRVRIEVRSGVDEATLAMVLRIVEQRAAAVQERQS